MVSLFIHSLKFNLRYTRVYQYLMEKVQKDRLATTRRSLDNTFLLQSNQEEIMASRSSTGATSTCMFDMDQTLHPIFLNDEEESVKFESDFNNCGKGKGLLLPEHTKNSKTKEMNQSLGSGMHHVTRKRSSLLNCNEKPCVNKRLEESRDDSDIVSRPSSIDAPLMTLEEKTEEQ